MDINKYFSKLLLFVLFFISTPMYSQIMWNFKGGVSKVSAIKEIKDSYSNQGNLSDDRIDWMASIEMEIPLSSKLNIETGLRYNNHLTCMKDYSSTNGRAEFVPHHIEMPIRLSYKQQLGKYFSVHAGIGPYIGTFIGGSDIYADNSVQVGVEPSVAINWNCLSLGVSYNTPCFYKGYKDENKNGVMVTLGIRFKSKAWKYIGAGMLAVASVGAAAGAAYSATQGNYSDGGGYSATTSSNDSPDNDVNGGTYSNNNQDKYNMSEQNAYNQDKRTYSNYDSMLSNVFSGNRSASLSDVKSWQSQMKKLREKWEKKGKSFPHSSNESKSYK